MHSTFKATVKHTLASATGQDLSFQHDLLGIWKAERDGLSERQNEEKKAREREKEHLRYRLCSAPWMAPSVCHLSLYLTEGSMWEGKDDWGLPCEADGFATSRDHVILWIHLARPQALRLCLNHSGNKHPMELLPATVLVYMKRPAREETDWKNKGGSMVSTNAVIASLTLVDKSLHTLV